MSPAGGLMATQNASSALTLAAGMFAFLVSGCGTSTPATPAGDQKAPAPAAAEAPAGQFGALSPGNMKAARPKAPLFPTGPWILGAYKGFVTGRPWPRYPQFQGETA